MGAVWLRFRAELRTRWRAWLGLALLIGFTAGGVLVLVAGARRTDSAYARFLRDERAAVLGECTDTAPGGTCDVTGLARVPGVAAVAPMLVFGPGRVVVRTTEGRLVSVDPNDANHTGEGELLVFAGRDDRFGNVVQREKILEGRRARPIRANEATINFAIAEQVGIDVGDRLRMRFAVYDGSGGVPEDVASAEHTRIETVRVVGLEVAPYEVPPPSGQWEAGIHLTPAFAQRAGEHDLLGQSQFAVALRAGTSVRGLERTLARRSLPYHVEDTIRLRENVERGIGPQVVALGIVAALAGLAALVVLGAALVRFGFVEAADAPTLRALGMSRNELWGLGVLRGLVIGGGAAAVAVVAAVLASPLMPIGQARLLEPSPGWAVDGLVLGLGALATLGFIVLIAAATMWRAVGAVDETMRGDTRAWRERPSVVGAALARLPVSTTAATGVRMALEPGDGATAVPVRSTVAAISVGLAVLVAALVFSTSLGHLLHTPRLAGWNWDVAVPYPYQRVSDGPPVPLVREDDLEAAFSANPDVRGIAPGILFRPFATEPALELGPQHVPAEVLVFGAGSVGPTVISGRAPAAAGEILLGPHTLDELGAEIGDRIAVATRVFDQTTERTRAVRTRLLIVGTGVVPLTGGSARLGRGATLTLAGVRALSPGTMPDVLWLRVAPGADPLRVVRAVGRSLGLHGRVRRSDLFGYQRGGEVTRVESVDDFPLVLAALMSVMAAGVTAHLLVVGTRRRQRDLAVLATFGFAPRQVRRSVAWQATTLAALALVLAVPVGIAAGRVSWRLYAEGLGVAAEPAVSWLALGATVAGVLLVANLIAIIPGITAARTRPAVVLRSE